MELLKWRRISSIFMVRLMYDMARENKDDDSET